MYQDRFTLLRLPPNDDATKRWAIDLGGLRFVGEGNNVIQPTGSQGAYWARKTAVDDKYNIFYKKEKKKPHHKKVEEDELAALGKEFSHIRGVRLPKPGPLGPPKTHINYISGLKEAAKARVVRQRTLESITKHGAVYPFKKKPPPKPPLQTTFIEDFETVRALHFDYVLDNGD